jgi:hypothetical protein
VVQKSAESLTPREGTAPSVVGGNRDESTAQALVWPFFVVVRHVLAHELSEMRFAQWDDLIETLGSDGENESLRVRIQVGAAGSRAIRLRLAIWPRSLRSRGLDGGECRLSRTSL